MATDISGDLTQNEEEREAVENAAELSPRLIFEAIRRNGEEELERPMSALWFSGIAAGILLSFSMLAEALLRAKLPDAEWRYIIENKGYSVESCSSSLGGCNFSRKTQSPLLCPR